MSNIPQLMTDVDCGWRDEVGGSLMNYALSVANAQEQAAAALQAVLGEVEQVIGQNLTYQSKSTAIQACKID